MNISLTLGQMAAVKADIEHFSRVILRAALSFFNFEALPTKL
jgi:hypothetical protein